MALAGNILDSQEVINAGLALDAAVDAIDWEDTASLRTPADIDALISRTPDEARAAQAAVLGRISAGESAFDASLAMTQWQVQAGEHPADEERLGAMVYHQAA